MSESKNPWVNYVSLDLETTGLDPQICDIIEIAMVKVRDGKIVDRFESFVFTPLDISQHVSYLTGITAADIEKAPDFIDLKQQVQDFIGDDPLVGHNIWFDWNFLTEKGMDLSHNALWDTYLLSTILYPELPSHSLETNTKYFHIAHEDSHRAMADVMACYELWAILMDSFPELSAEQRQQIAELNKKSDWPLLSYFLDERAPKHHQIPLDEGVVFTPQKVKELQDLSPSGHQLVHAPGREPVNLAHSLPGEARTLYIAGYPHTQEKLMKALPEAIWLRSPGSYLSLNKIQELWDKDQLQEAEATLLLKTVLNPVAVTAEELVLSHPEKMIWSEVSESASRRDEDLNPEGNIALQMREAALQANQVVTGHYQVLYDLELAQHFDRLVILEPELLENNATRCFGKQLTLESWEQESSDEDWRRQGGYFFAQVEKLGQSLVPSAQYPEHVRLTENITSSNEFIRLRSSLKELAETTTDENLCRYLKYYQAFFSVQDNSWVKWFTVHPKRGVFLNVAPLEVAPLLQKHLFDHLQTVVISDTAANFEIFPQMQKQSLERPAQLELVYPTLDEITGAKKDGDYEAQVSFLADLLTQLKGSTGVIFSSKTALKRIFFDLVKVIPEEVDVFGEDISGGRGKLQDRYLSSEKPHKVLFLTYRNRQIYPREVLAFDQMVLQSLPFDPPGYPVNQARSEKVNNAFMDYAVPRTQQNLLGIVNAFAESASQPKLYCIDRRIQEKDYAKEIMKVLEN